jgi:voltage-gated potassium channel
MRYLKELVLEKDTLKGRVFDYLIQALIVLSLVTFSIETLPDLSAENRKLLNIIEIVTVVIFTIEYLLRVILEEKKLKFIFSFMGLIDLIAVAPFYLQTGLDLRSMRIFRLFRLLRVFKLFRYNSSINRFRKAFNEIKVELLFFAVATLILLYVASVGIYYFEKDEIDTGFHSIFHAMWWAIATLTTVGYGDIYPITTGGKIFASVVIFLGLGLVAVPTGLIASAFSKAVPSDKKNKNEENSNTDDE